MPKVSPTPLPHFKYLAGMKLIRPIQLVIVLSCRCPHGPSALVSLASIFRQDSQAGVATVGGGLHARNKCLNVPFHW
jgi:hypothetical protein